MFKAINNDIRTTGVFIANFKHIAHLVLVFLLLTLNLYLPAGLLAIQEDGRFIHLLNCIIFPDSNFLNVQWDILSCRIKYRDLELGDSVDNGLDKTVFSCPWLFGKPLGALAFALP